MLKEKKRLMERGARGEDEGSDDGEGTKMEGGRY